MKLNLLFAAAIAAFAWQSQPVAKAFTSLGNGTAALLTSDLTDPENDGDPEVDIGYNATFSSSEEPGFGGGEFAFNVFDNLVGGGANKWCCGDQNNFPVNPISIDATLSTRYFLTTFTLTSGNDTPARDPRVWEIQGSNGGTSFTTIFSQNNAAASLWATRDEVLRFDSGADFSAPTAYSTFRFITTATGATTGARFQLGEIEYFGTTIPEPGTAALVLTGLVALGVSRRRRA